MLAATVSFSVMQALVRSVSSDMHPFQIVFMRLALALVIMSPLFLRRGLAPLRTTRLDLHVLRAVLTTVAMTCLFTGLSLTPLAQATALAFTAPVFATVLAIVFLGEVVRMRRWVAIGIGFAGTFVILRPGFHEVSLGEVLIVVSAIAWGVGIIITKILARTDSSVTIALYMALLMAPLSIFAAIPVWQWPTAEQLGLLFVIAGTGTFSHICFAQALAEADTSVVMPIDFCKLMWATLLGFWLFGEVPGVHTWIGGALIFAATTYIAYRESRTAKPSAPVV